MRLSQLVAVGARLGGAVEPFPIRKIIILVKTFCNGLLSSDGA